MVRIDWKKILTPILIRVHIISRCANWYIVAFYIAISYNTDLLTYLLSEVPPMDKQYKSAIIISKLVIFCLKYPNRRPRQLQFYVTMVASVTIPGSHDDLWSSWCHPDHLRRRPLVIDQLYSWIGGATPLPWPFLTSALLAGPVAVLVISIWSVVPRHYLGINIKLQNQKNNYSVWFSSVWISREDCKCGRTRDWNHHWVWNRCIEAVLRVQQHCDVFQLLSLLATLLSLRITNNLRQMF